MEDKPVDRQTSKLPRTVTNLTHLFELQLDRRRVHDSNRVCDVVSDTECLILGFPGQINE